MRKILTVLVAVVATAGVFTAGATPSSSESCRLENVGTAAQPWLVLVSDDPTSDGLCWSV